MAVTLSSHKFVISFLFLPSLLYGGPTIVLIGSIIGAINVHFLRYFFSRNDGAVAYNVAAASGGDVAAIPAIHIQVVINLYPIVAVVVIIIRSDGDVEWKFGRLLNRRLDFRFQATFDFILVIANRLRNDIWEEAQAGTVNKILELFRIIQNFGKGKIYANF